MERKLPRQLTLGEVIVAEVAETASQGAKTFVVGNLIFSIALSASLNHLWSMVEAQQIIVMMPLIDIVLPAVPAVFIN